MRPSQADAVELKPAPPRPRTDRARWSMPYAERPRYIQLETVTRCNASCPFCPQNELDRGVPRMPDEIWQKVVADTRGWGMTYRPFLTNEPFVDVRQAEITRHIKENDPTAKVEYNTNGELMTEKTARAILEAGVDIIRFSIDGLSRETYEPSRVGVSFDRVYERVPAFLKIWREEGHEEKGVFTEVRCIEVPENRHELDDYRAFWSPLCSGVVVTQLYQWPWTGQRPEDVVARPCLKVLDELFVYADGNVTMCCWDVHERAVIGNVREQTIEEIWNGYAVTQLRNLLDDGRRDLIHLCSRCNAFEGYDFSRFEVAP
jgi:radical SAM protein with 4Fe4S-binding SPASM domain